MTAEPVSEPTLDRATILRRASVGLALIAARGLVTRAIGLVGFLVIAGVFGPRDFGLLALGFTFLALGAFFSDFGLGTALLRGRQAPEVAVLEAMLGFQLLLGSAVVLIGVLLALLIGSGAIVTTIMIASLPLYFLRGPASITLERQLRYREIALVDVIETIAYTVGSVSAALAGAGPIGVAIVFLAKPLIGLPILLRAAGIGLLRPRLRMSLIRPILGFGWKLGAIYFVNLGRDQSYAVGTGVIGGLGALGLWNLVSRILVIPGVMLEAVSRIAFPTFSRLIDNGDDPRPQLQSVLPIATMLLGFVLAGIVTAGPNLLPALLGAEWRPSADILRWACAAVLIGAPFTLIAGGYFFAVGDASRPLRAASFDAAVSVVLGLALLPVIGLQALGVGMLAGASVSAVLLGRGLKRSLGLGTSFGLVLRPALLSLCVGLGGWLVASDVKRSIPLGAATTVGAMIASAVLARILLPGVTATFMRSVVAPSRGGIRTRGRVRLT